MLASDLANPEFLNPQNPDGLLHVEFMWMSPVDKWKTDSSGKETRMEKVPYVRIMKPGDNTSIIETPVRDEHKARWPDKWLYWQIKEGLTSGDAQVPGWAIDEWPELTDEQKRELKFLRFSVVEQIAGASDAQVQRMGMGGLGLREKARQALRARMGAETKSELHKKDAEIALLNERLAKLEALITAPVQNVSTPTQEQLPVAAEPPKKRGGRPKGSKNRPKE